jgi:PAT family beta-lactamase induction signal transducer AmpG
MKKYLVKESFFPFSLTILYMIPFGFASGLPLALTGTTLQAWLTVEGVDIVTIGLLSLVGIPYSIKFIWAPFMDFIRLPYLTKRRSWILFTQICLALSLFYFSTLNPKGTPFLLGLIALVIAFFSASQDIVIDAYRTDALKEKERGVGVATFISGYRIGMIVSGGLAMMMGDKIGWENTYKIMAVIMLAMGIVTFLSPENSSQPQNSVFSFKDNLFEPFKDILSARVGIAAILVVIFYKIGDAFAGALTTTFLIKQIGFTVSEVGTLNKIVGLISTIAGAFFGGILMARLGIFRSLVFFGILQALTNLGFWFLNFTEKSYAVAGSVIILENLAGGMGTAAFVSMIMGFCNKEFSATQFAILSAISSLGRVFIAPMTGFIVKSLGWSNFYIISFFVSIPVLFLLPYIKEKINLNNQG